MKNGENYSSSRRNFFKCIGATLLIVPLLNACKEKVITLLIRLSGTNHILGHKLRIKNFPKPSKQIHIPYLIVGGGITGLSAARQLSKKGISEFLLVELEGHLGGNSSNGENQYSKFPLGAHYLPLPNIEDKTLLEFLEEEKIILGYDEKGFPKFVFAAIAIRIGIMIALWIGFSANYVVTRDIYFAFAIAHVMAELPFLIKML